VIRSRRVVAVHDEREDDFGVASKKVTPVTVDEHYPYIRRNLVWRVAAGLLYWVVLPLPALALMWWYGIRLRYRGTIRWLGGCYMYANHTNWVDVILPYLLSWPRRAYIVSGPTAVSVPVVRHIVPMLGAVPLSTTPAGKQMFRDFLADVTRKGHPVAIYPEAHEWPYYNGIRDFPAYSFTYPVRTATPVVGYVVTYRQRRFLKFRRPAMTVTVGPPIMPASWEGTTDPKQVVRDAVHTFMCDTVRELGSFAWIQYELDDGAI